MAGSALPGQLSSLLSSVKVNPLPCSPYVHPLSFRYDLPAFYTKDTIYYVFFSPIPIGRGIVPPLPLTDRSLPDVGHPRLSLFLTFLPGMSLLFVLSPGHGHPRGLYADAAALALIVSAYGEEMGGSPSWNEGQGWIIFHPRLRGLNVCMLCVRG